MVQVLHRLSVDGGVQVAVRRLLAGSDPAVFEFHVVTARPAVADDRLGEVPAAIHPMGHRSHGFGVVGRCRMVLAVAQRSRSLMPSVVHLHSGTLWMATLVPLWCRGAAVVVEVHDAPGSGRHGRLTDLFEGLWVRAVRATVVCHSRSVADELRRCWRVPDGRLECFPLAVDLDEFRPRSSADRRSWRLRYGLDPAAVMLMAVGRVVPSKRMDRLVRAVGELTGRGLDVCLAVVGRGSELPAIAALAESLDVADRVRLVGFVDDLPSTLGAADVLVSPSEYEGFGLTLVEAMASAVAVVAVAVGGVTDVVTDDVGVLVAPHQAEHLADVLEPLVLDAGLRTRLGSRGRQLAEERFGVDQFTQSFGSLYRRLGRAPAPLP